jgi:hypothetical protein
MSGRPPPPSTSVHSLSDTPSSPVSPSSIYPASCMSGKREAGTCARTMRLSCMSSCAFLTLTSGLGLTEMSTSLTAMVIGLVRRCAIGISTSRLPTEPAFNTIGKPISAKLHVQRRSPAAARRTSTSTSISTSISQQGLVRKQASGTEGARG